MNDNITLPREVAEKALSMLNLLGLLGENVADRIRAALAAEQPKPEPVGVMQESCVMEGLVIPVVTQELPVGTPLYAALVTAETGKEIAALREENERLQADVESWRQTMAAATILGSKVTAENERLREENERLQLAIDAEEALYDSAWCAGAKAGWNFCADGNMRGYQAAIRSRDHLKELRRIRQVKAALRQEVKRAP